MITVQIDSNTLINLFGLINDDFLLLLREKTKDDIKLFITHLQLDENFSNYPDDKVIGKVVSTLESKGIAIERTSTVGAIVGVSKVGGCTCGGPPYSDVFDKIVKIIKEKEERKQYPRTPKNIARDALTAVTSLGKDYLITCDKDLYYAAKNTFEEMKKVLTEKGIKIPEVIKSPGNPESVARKILNIPP